MAESTGKEGRGILPLTRRPEDETASERPDRPQTRTSCPSFSKEPETKAGPR